MADQRNRKPVYQDYYTEDDYDFIMEVLPELIKKAQRSAAEILEPTIHEKRKVMDDIKNFIRDKKRKVYGGTAMNETIKAINPKDAIYDDVIFSDIEFYSPAPVQDMVELANLLHQKGYKMVVGREAQHEGTYSIFVNMQLYCDISYVPTRVYHGIQTIEIDGLLYVHPHFMIIDLLRMINDPINAAEQRWEKAFKRLYKLLRSYPLELFDRPIQIQKPDEEFRSYLNKIKSDFMTIPEVSKSCLISGFEAYNFFVRHAMGDRTIEQQARTSYGSTKLETLVSNVPFLEFVSINYTDTVIRLYNFIKNLVPDAKEITLDENYPLFQFSNYSVTISYKGKPLARVYEEDGHCIPDIKTTREYMYVSYQYLLMSMLMNKFRSYLEKDKEMYLNYGSAVSNLVKVRNIYLDAKKLPVINDSVFTEFKISCVGSTVSYIRTAQLRIQERISKGKTAIFRYEPEKFFNQSEEAQAKFDPTKYFFPNTSGNKITNDKNLMFKLDENGNIITETETSESYSDDDENDKTSEVANISETTTSNS